MLAVTLWASSPKGAHLGTVTYFTARQGVEAEEIGLTHITLGPDCVGRAQTPPGHLITEASTTAAWFAVWESEVAHLTAAAFLPCDTGSAGALSTIGAAVVANGPSWVALTRQCTLVVKGHQGCGRSLAKLGGCLRVDIKTVSPTVGDELR